MSRAQLGPGPGLRFGPDPARRFIGAPDDVHEVAGQPGIRSLLRRGRPPFEVLAPSALPFDLALEAADVLSEVAIASFEEVLRREGKLAPASSE